MYIISKKSEIRYRVSFKLIEVNGSIRFVYSANDGNFVVHNKYFKAVL